jgi:hypothetical protein
MDEKENEPIARYFINQLGAQCRTMIWATEEHVFLNYDNAGCQVSLIMSPEVANNMAADLLKALETV